MFLLYMPNFIKFYGYAHKRDAINESLEAYIFLKVDNKKIKHSYKRNHARKHSECIPFERGDISYYYIHVENVV